MTSYRLCSYSIWAYRITCLCTVLLSLLACLAGILTRTGNTPLQHFILSRQLLRQVPITFLCGILAVLLCDIIAKRHLDTAE